MSAVNSTSAPNPTLRSQISGWIIAAGLASTLAVWGGQTYWALLLALWGIVLRVSPSPVAQPSWPLEVGKPALAILISGLFFATVWTAFTVLHSNGLGPIEAVLPFVLFPWITYCVWRLRPGLRWFWVGLGAGAMTACALAVYQHHTLGLTRATGHLNAIPFGDLSVLFAGACVIGATSKQDPQIGGSLRVWLAVGSLAGIYSSLLSGSKGGWLSLLTVLVIGGVRGYHAVESRQNRRWVWTGMIVIVTGLWLTAPAHVADRIVSGMEGGYRWWTTGEITDGSVSLRLETWKLGIRLFMDSPWWGQSNEQLRQGLENYVSSGYVNSVLLNIDYNFENDYVSAAANGGILGLFSAVQLLLIPFFAMRHLSRRGSVSVKNLTAVGMLTCVFFAEFGMSIVIWGLSSFRQVYVSWLALLIGLIAVEYARARQNN